ncbi:MAG: riboflavin biosynthesis protein RibF [Vulcanimicrobiaceae bacterium]
MNVRHALQRDAGDPLVLAIGFFDGMHRGHQDIARETLRLRKPGWRAGVLTFSNHPSSYLRPDSQPPLICTREERVDLFARYGFEECFLIPFDASVASRIAEDFLRDVLIGGLGVRGVVVGEHFRFGHERAGDTALMARFFAERGVALVRVADTTEGGERISSTRIRRLVGEGRTGDADRLLGHSYELRGRVVLGAGRGHDLGFPTANLEPPSKLLPKDGVYAATARYDGCDRPALVSIGTNPTFDGSSRTIETWLRDFHETIYGRELVIRDLRYIREQHKYDDVAALLKQMNEDQNAVAFPSYG